MDPVKGAEIVALLAGLPAEAIADLAKSGYSSVGLLGLPPIERPRASCGRRANRVPSITLTEFAFECDPTVPLCETRHSVTWAHAGPHTWHIATKELVAHATRDVLADTGLSDRLDFFLCGFDLFRPRRDLYCLFRVAKDNTERQGPFVGAVLAAEGDAANSPRVWSQVYDLLCMFKAYHGATAPLVVLSTYARWRVFWLQGDTASSSLPAGATAQGTAVERLCAGPIMDRADPLLVPTIATALHKMDAQVSLDPDGAPISSPGEMRLAAKVNTSDKSVQWIGYRVHRCTSTGGNRSYVAHKPRAIDGGTKAHGANDRGDTVCHYVLTQDLCAGGDGHAWRARALCENVGTNNGTVVGDPSADDVVIKFGHESTDLQPGDEGDVTSGGCIWREATAWRLVWGEGRVRAICLCGWPALVMPYASPLARDATEAAERGVVPRVLRAIESMAAKGLCHDDLHWRHVGWVGSPIDRERGADGQDAATIVDTVDNGGQVVFFDLARVSLRLPDKAARRMKKALGLCCATATPTVVDRCGASYSV
ncbi:hypothetical protein pkur_cds_269 [Pandoravirus kuranda]|uniref:DUF5898 domain-containing protein n=1 Tax=Pandoravirus kuranda TaxID=3019033 RepID=A0AA95J234_9VIRU|nr:hypothetical protein pkur_cds_269 [Pandoravirus kuranda]